jgi:hypothetical protein
MARYAASKEGMSKGYWKIVDTTTGNAVESGMRSKAATVAQAAILSSRGLLPSSARLSPRSLRGT